ncbi:MAG TPA: adenylate/guanylate cyclase domain-containing protein [Chthoniobacterales bacterium]|jgi:class 3 adenylate cyclase|nr:adenylate/guanylate cyclase domain-containing protein [Chthoniobacterales bacterium]
MKRALLATLWIGSVAGGLAIALQLSGLLTRPSSGLARAIGYPPNEPPGLGNFVFVLLLAFAVAWTMLQVTERARRLGLFLLLLAELAGAAWVLHPYRITFPPLPAALAVVTASLLAVAVTATTRGRQRRRTARLFGGRLSQAAHDRLAEAEALKLAEPIAREATFVFCEIANEADLIDELSPAECAQLTREFIESATRGFLEEGGYLHAADGEGIRVLFGFPGESEQHALEAARAALAFRDQFRAAANARPASLGKIDLRIGVSSGTVVATVQDDAPGGEIVVAGAPLELARRLARANRIYGSQILLDPRSFSAAGKEIVARPIDFLRSIEVHDRLEFYELLALTAHTTPEVIARRDRFWTAIVYFREKRWNEAFAEFSRARGENNEPDPPLEWYLRRLEPLCLKMATEPAPPPGEQLIGHS